MSEAEAPKAVRLLSSVGQARERLQLLHTPKAEQDIQARIARLRNQLGEDGFAAQWSAGKAMDIREAIAQAQAPAEEPALV